MNRQTIFSRSIIHISYSFYINNSFRRTEKSCCARQLENINEFYMKIRNLPLLAIAYCNNVALPLCIKNSKCFCCCWINCIDIDWLTIFSLTHWILFSDEFCAQCHFIIIKLKFDWSQSWNMSQISFYSSLFFGDFSSLSLDCTWLFKPGFIHHMNEFILHDYHKFYSHWLQEAM